MAEPIGSSAVKSLVVADPLDLRLPDSRNTPWQRFRRHRLAMAGLIVLVILCLIAILAPLVAGHSPYVVDIDRIKAPPGQGHLLGTDAAGRDVWARLVFASRVSMSVGLVAIVVAGFIGTAIGLVSGYAGGTTDNLLMRFTELVMTFPTFFAIIIVVSLVGPNILNVMLVIGVLGWPGLARLVRGQVLSLRELDYVVAARAIGAGGPRIMVAHILPGVFPYVVVAETLGLASAILTEAGLSFLGLGVQIPTPSWGNMMNAAESLSVVQSQPWLWIPPGVAVALAVIASNFVGDGLRDALDPRMKIG
ncbi:MAG: ABC transporter permease [Chloroflexota bacterium]